MSQETLVSQTSLSDPVISWFPARPPSGYEALPCEEDSEDDSDVELCTMKPASDIEASPIPTPSPTSGTRDIESSPQDRPSPPETRTLGVLKMLLILLTAGLPSALFFSAFAWLVGGIVLCSIFKVPPYDAMDSGATFRASMAGAPVVALGVGALAFLDFVLRRLPSLPVPRADPPRSRQSASTAYDPMGDALAVASICALGSALAMPLGLLMMPRLATETVTFGAWHALAWSATGFGVPLGGILLVFLPQLLWCDPVDL